MRRFVLRPGRADPAGAGRRAAGRFSLGNHGPTSVNLTTDPDQMVELTLHSTAAQPTDVWIVCRYAPELLDMQAAGESHVYHEQQLRAEAEAAGKSPVDDGTALRPDRLWFAADV